MGDELKPVSETALTHIAVPPGLVQECMDDPEKMVRLTRGQLAIVQDRMVRMVLGNPDATIGQYAVVHERLAKNAKIETAQGTGGSGTGFSVVINLGAPEQKRVIDVKAEPVP